MLKKATLLSVCCLLLYGTGLIVVYDLSDDNLPDIDELETRQPNRVTKVYSADGKYLDDFHIEKRELLKSYDEIPKSMKDALIAVEDKRFFEHWGVDLQRVVGAALSNVVSGNLTGQGASTLTQQLARNLYDKVGRQRSSETLDLLTASYARKIREAITAVYIERLYTKQEILSMYLNTVFFGHDSWGLKSAARLYFDKTPKELNVEESATLAALLKAPNNYSPLRNRAASTKRRNTVLWLMKDNGTLTSMEYRALSAKPIVVRQAKPTETEGLAPHFVEHVRKQLDEKYGSSLYTDGLRIHTTLDSRLQVIAERVYKTEIGKVQVAVNKYLAAQVPSERLPDSALVQAAFIAMNPSSGRILAMIGGRDLGTGESNRGFNRATQAERQAGSSFKPFVYTAALDNNRFPTDELEDNALTITDLDGSIWDPENYDRKFKGMMTLRDGFKHSRNLIAIKLAMEIGPRNIRDYAQNMGITTNIRPFFAIAIGSSEVKLIDMVSAYSVFPNQGIRVEPSAVTSIVDASESTIYESTDSRREVLRPSVAILMTDMMRSVIDEGTGRKVRSIGFRPQAAGKTGTTNDYADAWFIGFTPHLVAGVWVGFDDPGLSLARLPGSRAALPLWAHFMKTVYEEIDYYHERAGAKFEYPEALITRRAVCKDTHKLATRYCPRRTEDLFIADGVLPEKCPEHGIGPAQRQQRF